MPIPGVDLTEASTRGVVFTECSLRPLRVIGGDWSFVSLPRADLRGSDLTALDPRQAELDGTIIDANQAVVLAGALGLRVR
ncbi:hypothetical protein AB5J62_07285 [Amycolatopsis sp. cg5]|uniref:hypothetical protein n=1 Tax=Amycolatopsis sp. cg5 TaxID=3238802 RepID=UPI003524E021